MASFPSTSKASIEPAVHTNSTGRNNAKSSAAASKGRLKAKVVTMKTPDGLKAMHNDCWFTLKNRTSPLSRWQCDLPECDAILETYQLNRTHYLVCESMHTKEAHILCTPRPSRGGARTASTPHDGPKRRAPSCADKPPATVNGDAQVPAKKSTGHRLPVGGAFMFTLSARPHSQGTPQGNAEDAASDKRKVGSAKGSGAGSFVDSVAAVDWRSPVQFQHPRGLNEPETSTWPSGDQGAQESEIIPPPTPPPRADHADTVQIDADDGDDSDCILIDDPINGDIEENPGAVKREAGDVNSRDAKAGASFKKVYQELELLHEGVGCLRQEIDGKVYQELELLHEEVGSLRQEINGLKEVHAAPPAASLPPPVLPKLPMETKDDLEALETFLADENNFEYMVSHLKSFDGSTLEEKAYGMMTGLFSLELAARYNYEKESATKRVFEGKVTEKAVRRAAMESFPGLASKEYTSRLRKWFRYAYAKVKRQEAAYVKKVFFGGY